MGRRRPTPRATLFALANVLLWPAIATGLGLLAGLQTKPGASVAYVLAVALSTYFGGLWYGVASAILSYLGLRYFFVAPLRSLDLRSDSVTGFVLFMLAALGVGYLLVRERRAKQRVDSLLGESTRLLTRLAASEERLGSIIDSSLDGIVVIDEHGTVEVFNHAAERLFGYGAEEVLGRNITMLMPEPDAGEHGGYLSRYLRTGEPHVIGIVREVEGKHRDGTTFPFELAIGEVRLDGGRYFTGFVRDLTERRRQEEERERRLQREQLLADAGAALSSPVDYEEALVEVARLVVPTLGDRCAIDLLDAGGSIVPVAVADGDPAQERPAPDSEAPAGVLDVVQTGRSELRDSAMIVPLNARGRTLGAISFTLTGDGRSYDLGDRVFAEELARRAAIAIENAMLRRAEQEAHASLRVTAERLERVHAVAAALSEAVSTTDALNVILTEGIAASGARAGVVGLLSEDGTMVDIAAARGHSPKTIETWRSFQVSSRQPLSDVVRTGWPFFCESRRERDERWPTFAGIGDTQAFVVLPLAARGAVIGGLALTFEGERTFSPEERELLLTIARQCGQALERARLFEHEHEIAVAVQRSLLPREVGVTDEVAVAARYLPASPGLEVGGDWYDVIRLNEGELVLSIGDVVGHGLHAAATMGQLRNAVRAYALERSSPPEIVSRLNRFVSTFKDGEFSTLFVGRVDLEAKTLEYTNAGHPPPILRTPDGETVWLDDARTFPVGVVERALCPSATVPVEPNSLLFVYTDGLVERRGQALEAGLADLVAVVGSDVEDPEELVDEIIDRIVEDRAGHADDIAMVAFRFLPVPSFQLRLDTQPELASVLRSRLDTWLVGAGADRREIFDICVACSEAFANAIEHPLEAAASVVDVEGAVSNGEVTITMRDYGGWRDHRLRQEGGLGLPLMRSLMSSVEVKRRPEGTSVVLRRRLAAPIAA